MLDQFLCRFSKSVKCRVDPCPFSHDEKNSVALPPNICFYYLVGQCLNGDACRFLHVEPKSLRSFIESPMYELGDSASSGSISSHHSADEQINDNEASSSKILDKNTLLCPLSMVSSHCPKKDCNYLHGLKCDICECLCLHPYDPAQQAEHKAECEKESLRELEHKLAMERSIDKICGICMEKIMEKTVTERNFGILEKCDHVFCLTCIRKWRQTEELSRNTIRSCPECRVFSPFVIPSKYWYFSLEDKNRIINNYKKVLSKIPCKHFQKGGKCPFGEACFYLHDGKSNATEVANRPFVLLAFYIDRIDSRPVGVSK